MFSGHTAPVHTARYGILQRAFHAGHMMTEMQQPPLQNVHLITSTRQLHGLILSGLTEITHLKENRNAMVESQERLLKEIREQEKVVEKQEKMLKYLLSKMPQHWDRRSRSRSRRRHRSRSKSRSRSRSRHMSERDERRRSPSRSRSGYGHKSGRGDRRTRKSTSGKR